MKYLLKLFGLYMILVVSLEDLSAQNWPVVIVDNIWTFNATVIEDYDKGYLLCNWNFLNSNYPNRGWLVKTDVNGNILWTKTFGDGEYTMGFLDAIRTKDNGILVSGAIGKYDHTYYLDLCS